MATTPIHTALCSFGMSGRVFHAPFITLHPGFRFYGVWERSKNLAQDLYPDVKTFRTYEDLLADPAIELVIVNTPSYTHYGYAKQALLAGKHVIVEKPFTATVAQAEELVALAAQQQVQLSVFQNRRWDSDYKTVKKIVEEGWLGEIKEAEFHYDRYNPALSPKAHKETPGPGAGCLYDLGPHLIDQALHLFGVPQAVFADLAITRPQSQVDDYFEILLYYPIFRVRLKSGYFVREAVPSFVVHGAKGSFLKPRADVQEAQLQAGHQPGGDDWGTEPENGRGLLHTEKDGTVIKETLPSLRGNYGDYYEGVYQALRHEQPMPVAATDGLHTIRIIEAAFASSRERKAIGLSSYPLPH
ncbi:MAG: Gfo/Idh/MocA family oxidoreductase [Chitinophagaceae bacterium]